MTTHVLDTAAGRPAAGLRIELWAVRVDGGRDLLREATTNKDGRVDGALLSGAACAAGTYELIFHAGDYLRGAGYDLVEPAFLDIVPIRFGIADASAHYHVPLLISPYGYSTYRGS